MDAVVRLQVWRDMYLDLTANELKRMLDKVEKRDLVSLDALVSDLNMLTYYIHKAYNAGVFAAKMDEPLPSGDYFKDTLCVD